MMNTLGQPDTVLLVGGSSDLAAAVAAALLRHRPLLVVLAARPGERRTAAADRLAGLGAAVELVDFDALDGARANACIEGVFDRHEVDVAVVAHGVLPDQAALELDPAAAVEVCTVNYTSAVLSGLVLARRMSAQGHGLIVALSSVAAVRPRSANYVYGSTKAGMDAFFTGLRDRLRGTGVRVLVVRPGFVRTRMTSGLPVAPFACDAGRVGDAVAAAVRRGSDLVWVPAALGPVMAVLRVLPGPLFRRLSRGATRSDRDHSVPLDHTDDELPATKSPAMATAQPEITPATEGAMA
jgi:decaprenylphospho-beta-D-erythro-pentofuranosid-2-ulose 2-reductase